MCLSTWLSTGACSRVLWSVWVRKPLRQIFRFMVWGFSVLPHNRRNSFLTTLVSDQTNKVHLITAKLNICEQFVAGLSRKEIGTRMEQNSAILVKQKGHLLSTLFLAAEVQDGYKWARTEWTFSTFYSCYFPDFWLLLEHDSSFFSALPNPLCFGVF